MNVPPATQVEQTDSDYLDTLGLEREPFASAPEEDFYYNEAQRAKCLHFLLHLAPYSDVLLLTGERGSGKSSLIQQFIARANPAWRICALDASEPIEPHQLLEDMAEIFLFDVSNKLEGSLESFYKLLHTMRNSALVPVLIIDEAQRLPLPVLQLLERLLETSTPEERQLCIILVGEHELEHRLLGAKLHELRTRVGHSFELPPFDEEETANYIRHRLAIAGMEQTALLTPARLRSIHKQSGGLPGRINEFAREMLRASIGKASNATTVGGTTSAPTAVTQKGKISWRKLLVAVLVLILAGVLLFQERINQWLTPSAVKPQAAPPPTARPSAPLEMPSPLPPASPPTPAPVEAEASSAVEEPPSEVPSAPETAAPIEAPPIGEKPAAAADSATQTQNVPAPSPAPAPVQESAPAPFQDAPDDVPQTAAGDDALRHQDWLRGRDSRHYTLQLLAGDRVRMLGLITDWGLDADETAATFYTGNDGRQLLALVYGDYASREAAQEAASGLTERFPGISPWIRSFASVQRVLNRAGAAKTPAVSVPAPDTSASAPVDPTSRLLRDEAHILSLDSGHYTLQVMAMDLSAAERRVRKWGIGSEVLYYRTLRGDRELVAVLHGDYGDAEAAQAAARQLSRRIPGITPWVRQVATIQNAIHAYYAIRR